MACGACTHKTRHMPAIPVLGGGWVMQEDHDFRVLLGYQVHGQLRLHEKLSQKNKQTNQE